MSIKTSSVLCQGLISLALISIDTTSVKAQITSANDGTGTVINQEGNQFNINGGSSSSNSQNLFHSFQDFNVTEGQTVNFNSTPETKNILGRVVGGNASYINGLIQVLGSNANLFLMNPAGIVFGLNSSLNIPADLTVTTATGIGFNGSWFNSIGSQDYSILIGTPSEFNFSAIQPGIIINEGNLAVSSGQNLRLMGGTVINTGELSAPNGNITIAAVPGEKLVRISQAGHLLNLELASDENSTTITPLSLPQLLTGGETENVTSVAVLPDGSIELMASNTTVANQPGTAIISGRVDVSSSDNSQSPEINITANEVGFVNAEINASETGTVIINANEGNIYQADEDSLITAGDAQFFTFQDGGIGSSSQSLKIDVSYLEAIAGSGGIYIDELTGLIIGSVSEEFSGITAKKSGDIILNVNGDITLTEEVRTFAKSNNAGNITLNSQGSINTTQGKINASAVKGDGGNIEIVAEGDITTGLVESSSEAELEADAIVDLEFDPDKPSIQNFTGSGGRITITSNTGNIDTTQSYLDSSAITGQGGDINILAEGDLSIGFIYSNGGIQGGNVTITSNLGDIDTSFGQFETEASSPIGTDGNITLTANAGSIIKGSTEVTFESDEIADFSGEVILKAYNDVTVNEDITTSDSIQIRAGRSIFINANIDTSGGNGNIAVRANNEVAADNQREAGSASIVQQEGTILNAGSGNILLELGDAGEVGNIQIEGLNTRGVVVINANTGNIEAVSNNALITADAVVLRTEELGGIGSASNPLSVNVNNLEATADHNIFLASPNPGLTIGGITDTIEGIETYESLVSLTADGNIILTEYIISNGGDINLSSGGNINTTEGVLESVSDRPESQAGDITLSADGNIESGEIYAIGEAQGGNINLTAGGSIDTTADILITSGPLGQGGNVTLTADSNIQTGFIATHGNTQGGDISISSNNGDIDTSQGFLDANSLQGTDGNITLTANAGSIITGNGLDSLPEAPSTFGPQGELQFNADAVANFSGKVVLEAYNDVTITQPITTSDSIQIRAGRSIFINANIDTSSGNGNIAFRANNPEAAADLREPGQGEIIQQPGTTINAGSGNILFQLGDAGEVGNIQVDRVETTGIAVFSANGGTIDRVSDNALIIANSAAFHTYGRGGIGSTDAPLSIEVNNLEAVSGEPGAFFDSPRIGLTVGGVTDRLAGVEIFQGGQLSINAAGDITVTEQVFRNSFFGKGGNIDIVSGGEIDTTQGEIYSFSANGKGGNVTLEATGNINTGLIISSGINQGGNIRIVSETGTINTTANGSIPQTIIDVDADVTSEEVAKTFQAEEANLDAYAPEGSGGNIILEAQGNIITGDISSFGDIQSGDVTLTSQNGNINTGVIFSTTENGSSGNIKLDAFNGNIDINHIATHSTLGTGGKIKLNSSGSITINNMASFGEQGSGNVNLQSQNSTINTQSIQTLSPSGRSGNITLNTYSISGDIKTANLTISGETGAGQISIKAADGSVITQDLESSSSSGSAGGVNIESGEDITTGNQTVEAGEGDANISNNAEGDINTGNQTASAENGNATVNNNAGEDITTGNQIVEAGEGDANISNNAEGNISVGNQTAIAENGNASINNNAGGDINTGNQTAIAENGNAAINNIAGGEVTTGERTIISDNRNARINETTTEEMIVDEQTLNSNNAESIIDNINSSPTNNQVGEGFNQNQPSQNSVTTSNFTASNSVFYQPQEVTQNLTEPQSPITTQNPERPQNLTNEFQNSVSAINRQNIVSIIENHPQPSQNHSNDNKVDAKTETQEIMNGINTINNAVMTVFSIKALAALEQSRNSEFSSYFGEHLSNSITSTDNFREVLSEIQKQTGNRSAVVYVTALPNQLDLVIFTADGDPLHQTIPKVNRDELLTVVQEFRSDLVNPRYRNSNKYLKSAQQLYQWIIAPIESELKAANIDTLLFSMDTGLRSLPIAALHDGQQFLIEKYSLTLIPSVSLMDTRYRSLQNTEVLGMGASQFEEFSPLPAVPIELETITQNLWQGNAFLEEEFTRENLIKQRQNYSYPIIHLATHGEFKAGDASNSYIQLWGEEKLRLDQLRELGWDKPAVELLVLSACRTALGDEQAELGFAGLAVQAGVKSALASLWYVSDEGTLGLMTEFYTYLNDVKIKAEALRQAQLAMIRGEILIEEGELRSSNSRGAKVKLPIEMQQITNANLSHPYYWSGFTMIGSPW